MSQTLPVFTLEDLESAEELQFAKFDNDDAFELGTIAGNLILERGLKLSVDIVIGDHHVYRAKLGASEQGSDYWLLRKGNVARDFGASSLLIKERHKAAGTRFEDLDVDQEQYGAHGGAIPIRVNGEIVATITTSGEHDLVDHEVAADAIAEYLSRR
jgi:uncharacterized protein (UPF0303 family)